MRIQIDSITETPEDLVFEVGPAWWSERCQGDPERAAALPEPASLRVRAYLVGSDICLEGELAGALSLVCGRCLTRYRAPIRDAFRLLLEPAGSRVPADPEGAETLVRDGLVLRDALDSGWFGGTELRLDAFVQELLDLSLPVQPLCGEACRGLCPRCGVDRNTESCDCEEHRPESPFAVLESLRDRVR